MSTEHYTPGPWEVRESLASGEVIFVRSGTRERIALAKTEADARLIAKCPEMYEYLAARAAHGDADAANIIAAIDAV